MDRVSLWTGRAVIQAYGCGHPWRWKVAVHGRACWHWLRRWRRLAQMVQWLPVRMASVVQAVVRLLLLHLLALPPSRSYGRHGYVPPKARSIVSISLPRGTHFRAYLEIVKRMMKGDTYIGRGCKQQGLTTNLFGNPFLLCDHG